MTPIILWSRRIIAARFLNSSDRRRPTYIKISHCSAVRIRPPLCYDEQKTAVRYRDNITHETQPYQRNRLMIGVINYPSPVADPEGGQRAMPPKLITV